MEVTQPLDHITHAVIGGSKSIDFGISNSAEFFQILSQSLYTDQYLAVVREVLCNAWDAHIASGRTGTPIQITLDHQYLTVRDFGFGIPHEDIGPIYGVYGNSTKKSDGKQTGGFGLGCKAPFAYTDHFEVSSFHGGTKSIYNMSKSNAQAAGKPGIVTLARVPTTEHGLSVRIPILGKDYSRFQDLIARIVSNGEILAKFNDKLLTYIPFSQAQHGYYLTTKAVMGDRSSANKILLRYGNVIYPVQSAKEFEELYVKAQTLLNRFSNYNCHYCLILQAPPDSISVTPSREALSLQDHTIKTLKKLLTGFLHHTKALDDEILVQAKKLIDEAVVAKDYAAIFNDTWGFSSQRPKNDVGDITDLVGMAQHQLQRSYPSSVKFRLNDVNYRVRKAMAAKVVDPHLAATFLKKLPEIKNIPCKYSGANLVDRSDWLHRRVIGKVLVKLHDAGLDNTSLFLVDTKEPSRGYGKTCLTPVRRSCRRNHLINLPYLRKAVVITTALTRIDERLVSYARHHPNSPRDGLLCYHIRSRKTGNTEAAINFFTKLGYEIVDLTKRQSWEVDATAVAPPRQKREPYAGLPALSNIVNSSMQVKPQNYRNLDAVRLPAPEFVLVIGLRDPDHAIGGFTTKATRAIVRLYGDRVGVAQNQAEYKRAIKQGAKDFQHFLEQELELALLNSPNLTEYFAYDYDRVKRTVDVWRTPIEALRLVYTTKELQQEFALKNNLTQSETDHLTIFRQATILSDDCTKIINAYIDSIPLAPENRAAVSTTIDNELIDVLDIGRIKTGLSGPKRQTYLDILNKALKG